MHHVSYVRRLRSGRVDTNAGRPAFFGPLSQASDSACRRPSGNATRYCCERMDAERVFDLERGELAVRPVSPDQKLAVAAEETRGYAVIIERSRRQNRPGPSDRLREPWRGWCCDVLPQTGFGLRGICAHVSLPTKVAADASSGAPSDLAALERAESEAARGDDGGGGARPRSRSCASRKTSELAACRARLLLACFAVVSGRRCCVACVSTSLPAPLAPPMRTRKFASNRVSC